MSADLRHYHYFHCCHHHLLILAFFELVTQRPSVYLAWQEVIFTKGLEGETILGLSQEETSSRGDDHAYLLESAQWGKWTF